LEQNSPRRARRVFTEKAAAPIFIGFSTEMRDSGFVF